jgi:hypothetical protein
MSTSDFFAADYGEARRKFRDAAIEAGARLASYAHPTASGPQGEALTTDVARLGPATASRVLMTVSATHGVEGFCGSGVQVGTFAQGLAAELPADTALLAVHAINPAGFAGIRRVTEDNVDLNRNFVDFAAPLPRNEAYGEIADALCPADWEPATLAASERRLTDYLERRGAAAYQHAVSGGQYTHPQGIFYGGDAPTWSRRTLLAIVEEHLGAARRIAVIDYHTGLGPYAHGERIVVHRRDTPGLARARDWYGEAVTSTDFGTSSSPDIVGDGLSALDRVLADREFTGMALEYGVRPLGETIMALRAENWLHHHGKLDSAQGREIKAALRDVFYGDRDDWKDQVFAQAVDAQRRALRGLAG